MARLWTDRHGHTFIRADGKCLSLDRLCAYAWGLTDDLSDSRELHHDSGVPWDTREDNLIFLTNEEHLLLEGKKYRLLQSADTSER